MWALFGSPTLGASATSFVATENQLPLGRGTSGAELIAVVVDVKSMAGALITGAGARSETDALAAGALAACAGIGAAR